MGNLFDLLIVNPFTNALLLIYAFVGNFGVSIILFTIIIRLLTHPIMAQQIKSSTAMQELMASDEWLKIQEKYKGDKEKLAQEQMRIYSERGVSPFSSCLPTLIQFPILIGFYQSIVRAIGVTPLQLLSLVRGIYPGLENITSSASLSALIPIQSKFLWMNLGQPEGIKLDFLPFAIPVLAIIVGLTTFVQTKLTVQPSANPNDQSSQMNQMMGLYMPVLLFYFALNFASGLAVYFITSNLVGIAQYAALGKVNWKNLFKFGPDKKPEAKSKSGKRS
ncbi:MAG: YidC/Oxa1 family membrane protein insertase [Chloroflexi bacterium]|nr:YidC/Oxa1 family membrane protein insertase [Chloroflexota bacterium]